MSVSFNQITMAGNIVHDLELRYTTSDVPVVNFRMAVNSKLGADKERVTYIDVTIFGELAKLACKFAKKGSNILVSGRLDEDTWQDDEGTKRFKHFISASYFRVISGFADNKEEVF